MKISTKTRYGLRALIELARRAGEGPVPLHSIARSQEISKSYLHSLFSTLLAKGLVRSVKGPAGGFLAARPPAEVTLLEIVEALEGPLTLVDCVSDRGICRRSGDCPTLKLWSELSASLRSGLAGMTLAAVAAEHGGEGKLKLPETAAGPATPPSGRGAGKRRDSPPARRAGRRRRD